MRPGSAPELDPPESPRKRECGPWRSAWGGALLPHLIPTFARQGAAARGDPVGRRGLNIGRQSIPTFVPYHRLNSGPFGTMGVGLPFAVGAKVAKPSVQVTCLHSDGSFGQNAMELDTAAPQTAVVVHHQPQRRLDRRPRTQQARPRPRLHSLRQDGRGPWDAMPNMSNSPRTAGRYPRDRGRSLAGALCRRRTGLHPSAAAPALPASVVRRDRQAWGFDGDRCDDHHNSTGPTTAHP